jgi:uncharacterized protein YqgC (DUF456 family)
MNVGHVLRTVAGVGLLILGVIGTVLPVMPGFVFFAAGIAVLGTDHAIVRRIVPYVHRVRAWLERRGILKPRP